METTTASGAAGASADSAAAEAQAAELPVYRSGEVPESLATMTQLKALRLKPAEGQEVKGLLRMYRRGYGWGVFDLYDPAGAVPMRPLSAKQEAAKAARRTCPECGEVRGYIVYRRCQDCARRAQEAAEELRGRTCASCRRVCGAPLRQTGHGVPAAPRCELCWFFVALRVQGREQMDARWCRSCPECGTQTATDDEAARVLAETGSWTPRCCQPCAVVREERRASAEQEMREAAETAQEARRREVDRLSGWAQAALADEEAVVLDTETTGLEDDARIVEISVLAMDGTVLLDTLVNPGEPIGEATGIHGITDAMVAGAPTFAEVLPRLTEALAGRRCLIYNASYDVGRLRHELTLHHQAAGHDDPAAAAKEWLAGVRCEDAMGPYSDWFGEWSDYWQDYLWQPLYGGHRALGDCRAVIGCLQQMAAPPAEHAEAGPWGASSAAPAESVSS